MEYADLLPIDWAEYNAVISSGNVPNRASAVLRLGLFSEDRVAAERACLLAMLDSSHDVQSAAALSLGHLGRRFRTVGTGVVKALTDRLNDEWMTAPASDALDDIQTFVSGDTP